MPTRAKLTVIGAYNYLGDDLFQAAVFPSGINVHSLIYKILYLCSQLELMIPDVSLLRTMIGVWSESNYYKWSTLYNTTQLEYNPLWNVDADETETTEREYSSSKSGTFSENGSTSSETDASTTSSGTSGNTRTLNTQTEDDNTRTLNTQNAADNYGKLAGFNSNTYNNVTNNSGTTNETGTIEDERSIADTGTITDAGTNSGSESVESSETETSSNSGTNSGTETISDEVTVTKRRTGNIGVTSSQSLVQQEREVANFNIYDVIANDFKCEFCVMVY